MPASGARFAIVAFPAVLAGIWFTAAAYGGGVAPPPPPASVAPDWESVRVAGDGDIVQAVSRIPHDPNPLGVFAAYSLSKPYGDGFREVRFSAADGTPLVGMLARHPDNRPRPGVVVVPGFTQNKDRKFVVELGELFARNGWHVLTLDVRGHGASAKASPAMSTRGWKETQDVLAAARTLRAEARASSVAVLGFSMGGRSLVRAMAEDGGQVIDAGIAVTSPLAPPKAMTPPDPARKPGRIEKYFLDFLGAPSFYDYYSRAARSYGADLRTLEAGSAADTSVPQVKKPLLLLYTLDDALLLSAVKAGQNDFGSFSLAYRDTVRDHPHVRTWVVNRGNHAGMLYLSDPHWFTLATLAYLKHWQAPDREYVTVAAPALDVLAEGTLDGDAMTYRMVVRNHGTRTIGPVELHVQIPPGARLERCWVGFEGLGNCLDGDHGPRRLSWMIPRLPGRKATAGPFVATVDVSSAKRGPLETRVWLTTAERPGVAEKDAVGFPQRILVHKPSG